MRLRQKDPESHVRVYLDCILVCVCVQARLCNTASMMTITQTRATAQEKYQAYQTMKQKEEEQNRRSRQTAQEAKSKATDHPGMKQNLEIHPMDKVTTQWAG